MGNRRSYQQLENIFKIQKLIHIIYTSATIQLQITTKHQFKIRVRQQDVISFKLFTWALENVCKALEWANLEVNKN